MKVDKGTSRSGIAKQLPKHDKQTEARLPRALLCFSSKRLLMGSLAQCVRMAQHLEPGHPGRHQGPRNMDEPKYAQGTETIKKQFL